jgi:hypothetical protein
VPQRGRDLVTFLTSNTMWQCHCEVFLKTIFKTVVSWNKAKSCLKEHQPRMKFIVCDLAENTIYRNYWCQESRLMAL